MKILILPNGQYLPESKDSPEVGRSYYLDDATTGTAAQNRTLHALINAIYTWMYKTDQYQFETYQGEIDLRCSDVHEFKDKLKYKYGQGFSHFQYADADYSIVRADKLEDIPDRIIQAFNAGQKKRVKGVLKSWADYSLSERKDFIDKVKHLGIIIGCDSKKFHDILDGMEEK